MKAFKGLILFCFLATGISSCFDPPEFAITPVIDLEKIEFKVTPDPSEADSLIVYVNFRDGNGDMGLNDNLRDDPYHEQTFFLEDAGEIIPIGTVQQALNNVPGYPSELPMIVTPNPPGKLVTNRSRDNGYGFLPAFNSGDLNCRNYTSRLLLIAPIAKSTINDSFNIVDTLRDQTGAEYYVIRDTLHFQRNLNHYNIIVRFYESSGGPFTEFSWEDEFCTTFNGRYPILADESGPLEGTIRYAMTSTGFTPLFSIKDLALDIIVKDRAFNKDSVRSNKFKLQDIRVN